ncbi:Autoinducer 2 sensor kinase/phosphatase LuxQ [Maioricimonas rarisocia]|uniref:histidine kinase n=1 Tax=Maioricimonas rarisocia TaxID=2528026 RepID=A0A517Z838_9PLAN|nr:PAS domain-containing hybrid sensor histidine kinase/response regulator [Maioricimonas rarisocia]QDU38601.1 Autoinducer 2 sensor kinase/phosphatase LuxQ [Maioricimonas rarisocia]
MIEFLLRLFDTAGFPPRWQCGIAWSENPEIGWLHIGSDLAVFGAYCAIPIALAFLLRHLRGFPFPMVMWLFVAFIFSCGMTHLIDAGLFYWPAYRLSALARFITAVISWATVIAMCRVLPETLTFRSRKELEQEIAARTREFQEANRQLQKEIAERRRIEESWRETAGRLRLALHAGRMGAWDWNVQTGDTTWDETEFDVCGLDPSTAVDERTLINLIHPDDVDVFRQQLNSCIEGGSGDELQVRIVPPNGNVRWISNECTLVRDENGNPLRVIGVNYDVTEQREAELHLRERTAELEAILDHMGDGVIVQDSAGGFPKVNRAAIEMYGCGTLAETHAALRHFQRGSGGVRVLDENGDEMPFEMWPLRRAHRFEAFEKIEATIIVPDRERTWTGVFTGVPIVDDDGSGTLFIVTIQDISGRKAYESELQEAREDAVRANQSKSTFLAHTSHEIRTPMTAIIGYADILASALDNREQLECVATIRRNSEFLLEIINDILDLSKIEAGRLEVEQEPCSPVAIVHSVHSLMRIRATENDLELVTEFDGPIPSRIQSDSVRLRQILVNLVGNALKFTTEGSIRLRTTFDADGPEPAICFDVIDTGPGIEAARIEQMFEPFVQIDATNHLAEGTGLGLTISRRLAELLGGTLTATSEPGVGSTFTLRIVTGPVDELSVVDVNDVHELAELQVGRVGARLDGRRVLVVDDRRDIQLLARHFLIEAGAEVITAANGQEAVDLACNENGTLPEFDAVVMDMQMPVLDGFEATKVLRARGFDQPVIAVTAGAMQGDRDECLKAGCNAYLTKPIDGVELVRLVARHVDDC